MRKVLKGLRAPLGLKAHRVLLARKVRLAPPGWRVKRVNQGLSARLVPQALPVPKATSVQRVGQQNLRPAL